MRGLTDIIPHQYQKSPAFYDEALSYVQSYAFTREVSIYGLTVVRIIADGWP